MDNFYAKHGERNDYFSTFAHNGKMYLCPTNRISREDKTLRISDA
jgi:hypothetical protein